MDYASEIPKALGQLSEALRDRRGFELFDVECVECANLMVFRFRKIGMRQTKFAKCESCGATVRACRVV